MAKRVALEEHIGVGERDDLPARMRDGCADGGQFAPLSRQFDDPEAFITGRAGSVRRAVGATIADHDARETICRVVQVKSLAYFRLDQLRLVVRGDHDRDDWLVVLVSEVRAGPKDPRRPRQRGIAGVRGQGSTDQRAKPE